MPRRCNLSHGNRYVYRAAHHLAVSGAPAWASEQQATLSAGYLHVSTNVPGSDELN
ncbi:Ail/Lom family outer membrane beta-barrel protein, partial [Escherichia coli]|nr:Ail/Lom family outer membrane beta-barrel protein [Escherichia coli]EHZ0734148.1 Ail/Lom family outer membrane beta-barrel protein [Escherichia coli]